MRTTALPVTYWAAEGVGDRLKTVGIVIVVLIAVVALGIALLFAGVWFLENIAAIGAVLLIGGIVMCVGGYIAVGAGAVMVWGIVLAVGGGIMCLME
ncbi:hypothetical protein [Mycolicibacterium mageritense]|uniref:hypothetical protein n=1 Tax=Mycolicibacterium mageritense TaxID=53462 RepID=UPI0011D93F72|nr:hypothetical protein [Mycolicibacterium mageritense]TXI62215.1 MAG: hypothetical protein E6Q55_13700 [Mycolicibacterium mageritense]